MVTRILVSVDRCWRYSTRLASRTWAWLSGSWLSACSGSTSSVTSACGRESPHQERWAPPSGRKTARSFDPAYASIRRKLSFEKLNLDWVKNKPGYFERIMFRLGGSDSASNLRQYLTPLTGVKSYYTDSATGGVTSKYILFKGRLLVGIHS